MKNYLTYFTIAAVIASFPLSLLFVASAFNLNAIGILLSSGLPFLFWGSRLLLKKNQIAFGVSLIPSAIVWVLLLYQTIKRVFFIVENGGMERADGIGSPLAYLLGLVTEQALFIPLSAVIAIGVMQLCESNRVARMERQCYPGNR